MIVSKVTRPSSSWSPELQICLPSSFRQPVLVGSGDREHLSGCLTLEVGEGGLSRWLLLNTERKTYLNDLDSPQFIYLFFFFLKLLFFHYFCMQYRIIRKKWQARRKTVTHNSIPREKLIFIAFPSSLFSYFPKWALTTYYLMAYF